MMAFNAERIIHMLKTVLLTIMLVTALAFGSSPAVPASSLNLSQFQWKNRLLFLFAPDRNHPDFDTLQKSLASRQADVADRDLVVFEIIQSGPSSMRAKHLDSQSSQSLRDQFGVRPGDFAVILIGKDSGIKLNRREQTDLKDIFDLIDAMPMRQVEMRQKSQIDKSRAAEADELGGTK